jgi:hypothetical protein
MTGLDASTNEVVKSAEGYLVSLDNEVDQGRRDELRQEIEEFEERREELVQDHGEGHNLVKKVEEVLDHRQEEIQELEQTEEQVGAARENLLEKTADEFELSEQWLQSEVVEAINHALYNQRNSNFMLSGEEIQTIEDIAERDELERIDQAEVVILLAKDRLEQSEKVREQYERLATSKAFPAFEVLAENGNLDPAEVAEKLNEKKTTVNNWLKNPINRWDRLIPFYRPKKGEYDLSTTGRYFYKHYYDGDVESVEPDSEESMGEKRDEEDTQAQATLNDTAESSNQSAEDNSDGIETNHSDLSDVEDTEQKAKAMFSRVSDKTDN